MTMSPIRKQPSVGWSPNGCIRGPGNIDTSKSVRVDTMTREEARAHSDGAYMIWQMCHDEAEIEVMLRADMIRELFDIIASKLTEIETTNTDNLVETEQQHYTKFKDLYTEMYKVFQDANNELAEEDEEEDEEE